MENCSQYDVPTAPALSPKGVPVLITGKPLGRRETWFDGSSSRAQRMRNVALESVFDGIALARRLGGVVGSTLSHVWRATGVMGSPCSHVWRPTAACFQLSVAPREHAVA